MNYTIQEFWKPRFKDVVRPKAPAALAGWLVDAKVNPSFVEADLTLRDGFQNLGAPIWFIAAPGAVGKSTLAKEISAQTGSVYLDLAKADSVAGNYLTGGLVKNDLLSDWQEQTTAVLIDALDEARLRVTQGSFEDFLNDVHALSKKRTIPTVFLGRVGIVEEAWLALSDQGVDCPIFDIGFFDTRRAELFIMSALDRLARKPGNEALLASITAHKSVYALAAASFVIGLDRAAASDGARFAGYAPVLEAVATALASVTNPASLDGAVREAMRGKILQQLTEQILKREAGKLRDQLPSDIPASVKETLYCPAEQLARLGGVIYQQPAPLPANELQPQFISAYDAAVAGFMPNHPFLDGTGRQPSGAVFSAAINAHALFSASAGMVTAAEKQAGNGPHTPNPFLVDFYLDNARLKWGDNPVIPPEHVVALYESVRARSAVGDIVRLTIEGEDDSDNADVEIQVSGGVGDASRRVLLQTSQAGVLRFGRQVNGVSIDVPQMDVVIGSGNSVELVAPVELNVARLTFDCSELVVLRNDQGGDSADASVTIEAKELLDSKVTGAPSVRKGSEFAVSWPGASVYPWSTFATISGGANGADVSDALRALRRLVLAFRSHSKGRLARYRDKIEHVRMTKGDLGIGLREQMVRDGILSLEDEMYFLDPTALGALVGVTYQDLKLKRFSEKARKYVSMG